MARAKPVRSRTEAAGVSTEGTCGPARVIVRTALIFRVRIFGPARYSRPRLCTASYTNDAAITTILLLGFGGFLGFHCLDRLWRWSFCGDNRPCCLSGGWVGRPPRKFRTPNALFPLFLHDPGAETLLLLDSLFRVRMTAQTIVRTYLELGRSVRALHKGKEAIRNLSRFHSS